MNNKKQKCEFYMNEFLKLDKNERLPLSLTIHLLLCKDCRTIVRKLTLAEQACKMSMEKTVDSYDPAVASIMKAINSEYKVEEMHPLITDTSNNSQLSLSFYLVFAGIVTAYCAMFVGCNMDFFVKHINRFAQIQD